MSAPEDSTRPQDGAEAWETPSGVVKLTAPSGVSPYYRLDWTDPDTGKRRQSTAGRVFEKAWKKAVDKERALSAGENDRHQQPLSVGIAYWLDPKRKTPRTAHGWGDSHRSHMEAYARDYFTPELGNVKLAELRKRHIQKVVDLAPTPGEGKNLRKAAASLIAALHQGDLLPDGRVIDLSSVWWHGLSPVVEEDTEDTEDSGDFVPRFKRPSNEGVKAFRLAAESLPARGVEGGKLWWRGLMVETAAYAGPRWSELIALTAYDVHPEKRRLRIHWRVSQPAGKPRKLAKPKMAKRRTTMYPSITPTGYRLEEALRRRAEEALAEQEAGRNPRALLFPNRKGGWMHTGNFHRDIFTRAAKAAEGWESHEVVRSNGKGKTKTIQSWNLVWHSFRHTFCTFALEEWNLKESTVADLAGHADANTTRRLYVGVANDAFDEVDNAPEPWV